MREMIDDRLSGFPNLDRCVKDKWWPGGDASVGVLLSCWKRDVGSWGICNKRVANVDIGLCADHLEQLKESN